MTTSNGPLTPGEDPEPTSPVIDYSPATVVYNEAFENQLMSAILYPSEDARPKTPISPPIIPPTALPIPLDSQLRTHPSPIPGVLVTHPNGYYTGGPGPSPSTVDEYAARFIEEHNIQDGAQLERMKRLRIAELLESVRDVMREREEAVRKNEEINKKLEDLEIQRSTERRVQEKIKEERQKRKG